jgi:membrane protease YdiL (CAAX protease family)
MQPTFVETNKAQRLSLSSRRPLSLPLFFVITFAVSWLGAIPMILDSWRPGQLPPGIGWLQLLLFFGTALAALFVVWWNEGKAGVKILLQRGLIWRIGWRWYVVVLLGPALLFWSALRLSVWFGGPTVALQPPSALLPTFGISLLAYLLLNTEEIAWRGYALPVLLQRYTPWHASLILGILLGAFHLPLFLLKGGHPAGYPLPWFLVMILALTVIFTWLLLRTKGSLLLAHLFHQTFNSWAETIPFFPRMTGSLLPMMVTIGLLLMFALLIGWSWFRQNKRSS